MLKYITIFLLSLSSCGLFAQSLAFPTAEGYGKYTTGGHGGRVLIVTNLNDSGKGSLRDAIEQKGARTIVFAVDGTIDLKSKLIIQNDSVTIAGQSAPGDGICLKGYPFYIRANNVIVRYIRARMGDIHQIADDAMGAIRVKDLIIDHCSVSWSVDECLSVYNSENVTVQWCIISHSLSKASHTKGAHGFGGIWGGCGATFHHNLIAHNSSRNPRFASDGCSPVDFRNNVVYNWGFKSAYGGGRNGKINFVANYYKPGPATSDDKRTWFLDPAEDGTGSYFVLDNVMEGSDLVTTDNWKGVGTKKRIKANEPFPFIPINQNSAEVAYLRVLNEAGCSHHRDSYDTQVIEEVKTGTANGGETYKGGNKGIIDSQNAVGGWPLLKKGTHPKDSDMDGIPDDWEISHKMNPQDNKDANQYTLSKEYTNIEVYLNSLVAPSPKNHYSVLKKQQDQNIINKYPQDRISDFSKQLEPVGRILESEEYYVWCCAPIYGEDGKVHVFYSRWRKELKMGGWIRGCEIAHAVADTPEGPYTFLETVLAPREGYFDASTCHNPHIQYINGTYYLFYMGNSDGTVYTKRIGLATAQSINGPWIRSDKPILEAGTVGAWDDCNTTNPAFINHPNGQAWLYYKSWNKADYQNQTGAIRANRKYGLALAHSITGEYKRYENNPVVDFSKHGDNKQVEDAYVYIEDGKFKMLMRDMGYFDHEVGLIFESTDGLNWSEPQIAWFGAEAYLEEPPAPSHLKRYGRFERPQLLMKDGKPTYLFNAMQGGQFGTSSGFIFKIKSNK